MVFESHKNKDFGGMTPVERCQYLYDYWTTQAKQAEVAFDSALDHRKHWQTELFKAEIAEKLAQEHELLAKKVDPVAIPVDNSKGDGNKS